MEVHLLPHMNGGEAKISYAENSLLQKLVIKKAKHVVEESISELCQSSLPECISIADLGCSSGPNALLTIQEILECIIKACRESNRKPPSILYFLSDLEVNDFNTLFKMLPGFCGEELGELQDQWNLRSQKSCFIAAMPGSYFSRLFPDHSIHFVHSSYSLHYLSQVPIGLLATTGDPLNKRNICLAETSPISIHEAYLDQFRQDFTIFLKLRYQEMATSGQLSLTFICKNDESDGYDICEYLGVTIYDMVKEGLIEESKLATFNLPYYAASIEEIQHIIECEGSFRIRRLENIKLPWDANISDRKTGSKSTKEEHLAKFVRACLEPMLASHFGECIMDDLFIRYGKQAARYMETGKGIISSVIISLSKK